MPTPYFANNIRILTPQEIFKIYMYGEKPQSKAEFLFFTMGFRYNEGQDILNHPEWFDPDNRIIHFRSNRRWDRALNYKDRDIYLSYWDVINVHNYLMTNRSYIINPKHCNLTRNMGNWAKCIPNMDPIGVGVHCLRATRFVWLLKAFPKSIDSIIESMDYNPTKHYKIKMNDALIKDYIKVPFTKDEIALTKAILHGWSGAPTQY